MGTSDQADTQRPISPPVARLPRAVRRKLALTRLSLVWERLWPVFIAPLCLAGLYVTLALVNLWQVVPGLAHWAAVIATVAGSVGFFITGLRKVRWPTQAQALRRMETGSQLTHRPLTGLMDACAGLAGNRGADSALWAQHQKRLQHSVAQARAIPPRSAGPAVDVYALRILVLLLGVSALVYAGREAPARLAANLLPGVMVAGGSPIAFDAWITPPAYTGVPPLFLSTHDGGAEGSALADAPVTVPTGSVLSARVYGASQADIRLAGTSHRFDDDVSGAHEIALPLETSGDLSIRADGRTLDSFTLAVTRDVPPQILFTDGDALSVTAQLSLAIGYDLVDDYGVTHAEMRLTLPADVPASAPPATGDDGAADTALGTPDTFGTPDTLGTPDTSDAADTLGALAAIEPPVLKLPLPSARVTDAEGAFAYKDLTSHPWAGLQVAVTLAAFDEAGQQGTSETRLMRLPLRRFTDPLARAVIEQRQRLARTPEHAADVAVALNALTLHPEGYYQHASDYLPLRAAYWRLKTARHADALAGIYDLLWDIALHFEDGGLSLAEAALRDAQDALMEALANGASDAEIDRLMAELRTAMEQFLETLAQQQLQALEQGQTGPANPNMQGIERGDLDRMLDALQDLAQSGSRAAAQQMLSELRQLMENLTTGIPGQMAMTPPQSAMNDAIGEMGDLIDQQRALQDDTVQQGNAAGSPGGTTGETGSGGQPPRGEPQPGQSGQAGQQPPGEGTAGQPGQNTPGALSQRQEALRNQLDTLRQGLEGSGVETPSALGRANQAMRDAEEALETGNLDRAARRQGDAIEDLRTSAQALAESLLEDLAMSAEAQGQNRGGGAEGRDPLGRPQRSAGPQIGGDVRVPDESDVQRARRILEELQRRAGDRNRPPIELDYLNRLLQRF